MRNDEGTSARNRWLIASGIVLLCAGEVFSVRPFAQSFSQLGWRQEGSVIVGTAYHFDVSPPLRDITPIPSAAFQENEAPENWKVPIQHVDQPDGAVEDPSVSQPALVSPSMPATSLNFDGMTNNCSCYPPDTNGEAGLTQYVEMDNVQFQVFNKATGASLYGPALINTLWSGAGGVCSTTNFGDPVVIYDQIANRWIISQFNGSGGIATDECIAVSTTSDATGSYYRYAFHLGSSFFDYPKLSVWPDAYYMSMNVFSNVTLNYLGPQPFAFDRAAMVSGNPAATFVTTGITGGSGEWPHIPADFDGTFPPPAGAPATFVEFPGTGAYRVFHMHADFITPASTTFNLFASPAVAGFTMLCPTTSSCVPQAGVGVGLDGLGDRLMFRLAYRNFGDHESVVGNFSVSSGGVAAPRWFELRGVTNGPVTVFQESTYQPDTTWRWMSSAAMDHQGNLAVGFSASSSAINPQIRYAGRLVLDPANTLAQGEAHMFDGTGSQTGSANRWGDYSDLTIDPVDDCTFWYTTEYLQVTSVASWRTRIAKFRFPGCRRPFGDFDDEGKSDRTVFRPGNNGWYTALSGGGATFTVWGTSNDIDVASDYNGDGKADIAVFRPSTGVWWIVLSNNGGVVSKAWGTANDIPMAGDYDGDGKADLIVWRPSTGVWYISRSSGGTVSLTWGATGDLPLVADFDGDGRVDLAAFRPSTGTWFVNYAAGGGTSFNWGTSGDVPVAGDFDGDGRADYTVFRPSSGVWYSSLSAGGAAVVGWGTLLDIPVQGDLDGDGKSDFTVWRPSDGTWYTQFRAGGAAVAAWGTAGDKPTGRLPGT
jgi:hypothetical protein